MQALHRVRQRLITAEPAIINQLRGLLRERGLGHPGSGRARFERYVQTELIEVGKVDLSAWSRAHSSPRSLPNTRLIDDPPFED